MAFTTPRPLLTLAARDAREAKVSAAASRLPSLGSYPQESLAAVEGALLSDAGITCKTGGSHGLFSLSLSGEDHMDWLHYVNGHLESLGLGHALNMPTAKWTKNKKGDYMCCRLWTRRDPFFTMLHRRWYPGGVREVPENFSLVPTSLANWFMGDACSSWCFDGLVSVYFSTQCFGRKSTDRLKADLSRFGIMQVNDHNPSRGSAPGVELAITSSDNVRRLMEIVDPLVLPSYRYKIKYPRRLKL